MNGLTTQNQDLRARYSRNIQHIELTGAIGPVAAPVLAPVITGGLPPGFEINQPDIPTGITFDRDVYVLGCDFKASFYVTATESAVAGTLRAGIYIGSPGLISGTTYRGMLLGWEYANGNTLPQDTLIRDVYGKMFHPPFLPYVQAPNSIIIATSQTDIATMPLSSAVFQAGIDFVFLQDLPDVGFDR